MSFLQFMKLKVVRNNALYENRTPDVTLCTIPVCCRFAQWTILLHISNHLQWLPFSFSCTTANLGHYLCRLSYSNPLMKYLRLSPMSYCIYISLYLLFMHLSFTFLCDFINWVVIWPPGSIIISDNLDYIYKQFSCVCKIFRDLNNDFESITQ